MHCDVAYREECLLAALAESDVKKMKVLVSNDQPLSQGLRPESDR